MPNPDFREFIQSLNDNRVRYLVVGGYAVALHGHPRYTQDLDIWISRAPENAVRIVAALKQFGFESLGLLEEDFLAPGQVIQLGQAPNRIDLITSLSGVGFGECYPDRKRIDIDGLDVFFVDEANLKANKRAAGRHQDLADVENLGG